RLATTRAKLAVRMDSLSPFLQDSFIPYFMPVYPGALKKRTQPEFVSQNGFSTNSLSTSTIGHRFQKTFI
ncbi:MAG: hypothetical protein M3Y57_14615, partial [Acidobacteriota bacterium]|nr:hypothetical protein [Acidobacteriota bacterium]